MNNRQAAGLLIIFNMIMMVYGFFAEDIYKLTFFEFLMLYYVIIAEGAE